MRAVVLLLGIVLPQLVLYAPSLFGAKVLLPLDILQRPGEYMPYDRKAGEPEIQNPVLSDQVEAIELRRQFATAEVRAGRLPLWNPHCYCGAPFLAANNTAVLSPFRVLDYLAPGPTTIAWGVMLRALVGGLGVFWFLRVALRLGFWPSSIGAWCFPLSGFQVLWTGFPPSHAALWLPWVLLAVDRVIRRPFGFGAPLLGVVTGLLMVSGHAATGAQVLVASGFYFVGATFWIHGRAGALGGPGLRALGAAVVGWLGGALLSAPQTLPTVEYLQTSFRVAQRGAGVVETAGQGLSALPQMLLPFFWGQMGGGAGLEGYLDMPGNRLEHAATAYGGLFMTLVFAPFAWCVASQRRFAWLMFALAVFGLGQALSVPGLSLLFESFPMKFLRNNRLAFLTGFAVIVLGAMGLHAIWRGEVRRRWWTLAGGAIALVLGLVSLVRAARLPTPQSDLVGGVVGFGGVICLVAAGCAALLAFRPDLARRTALIAALLGLFEMIWSAHGVNPQTDPELYYPRNSVLEQVAAAEPGRTIGYNCLPANLLQSHGLYDVRGYDGADPAHLVNVLELARDPKLDGGPEYAVTQWFRPRANSPLIAMLGLRYVVLPGRPTGGGAPKFRGPGFFAREFKTLPRPFVPRRVVEIEDPDAHLAQLARPDFSPAAVAFVSGKTGLGGDECRGSARIVNELPCELRIEFDMETPGLVVLSDLWYEGWNASIKDQAVPVLRTNHAFRGIPVPAGKGTIELRYEPASFRNGLMAFAFGLVGLFGWCVVVVRRRRISGA